MHYEQTSLEESDNSVDFEGENETEEINQAGALEAVLFTRSGSDFGSGGRGRDFRG